MRPSPTRILQAVLCGAVLVILTLTATTPVQAQTRPADPQRAAVSARVDAWLAQMGLNYRKTGATTWLAFSHGKEIADVPILIAAGSSFVVVGTIVAKKDSFERSLDLMFKLLRLNHSADFVKVGFDDDEDLFVRVELRSEQTDSKQFKNMIDDVTKTADEAQKVVKLYPKTR
jgi:hypothetical protein